MRNRSKDILAVLYMLTFLACGDGPSEPDAGDFVIDVTGAVTERVRGQAWFGADATEDGAPIFGIVLGNPATDRMLILGRDGDQTPTAGTYAIRAPGSTGEGWDAVYIIGGETLDGLFLADSGQVVVSAAGAGRLRGSIRLYASSLLADGQTGSARVTLEGTFDARQATQGIQAARQGRRPFAVRAR